MRLGFPKESRLRKRPEFDACFESGRRRHSENFIVIARPRREESGPGPRLGLVVSRKVGHSVARNRVKRLLREFFRLHRADLPAPVDLVVIPKRQLNTATLTLAAVEGELAPVLGRIRKDLAGAVRPTPSQDRTQAPSCARP